MNSNDRKKILVVSQYYYPEQFRVNDICVELVKRGYDVTVLTGIPNYPDGKFFKSYGWSKRRRETVDGVHIIRMPIIPRGKNSLTLVLNYLSFAIAGSFFARFTRLQADHVFIYQLSPVYQALPAIWFSRRRKIPCLIYVMDLWPESVEAVLNINNPFIMGEIGHTVDYIYRNCDKILTSSRSFIQAIAKRGQPADKLCFWPQYAEAFYQPIDVATARLQASDLIYDGTFNLIFTGNIGFAQGLDVLVDAAVILQHNRVAVRFNIIGDGRAKQDLLQKVSEKGMEHYFHFLSRKPATDIPYYLAAGDMAVLCLSKSIIFDMTIPAKFQSYLACGAAIIGCADGEVKNLINDSGVGVCCSTGDSQALADMITRVLGQDAAQIQQYRNNALAFYQDNYRQDKVLDDFDELIQNTAYAPKRKK